jgi:hypothetical protein
VGRIAAEEEYHGINKIDRTVLELDSVSFAGGDVLGDKEVTVGRAPTSRSLFFQDEYDRSSGFCRRPQQQNAWPKNMPRESQRSQTLSDVRG